MMNLVALEGRMVNTPELKVVDGKNQERKSILNFSIAVDNWERDAEGNRTTSFFNCTAFGSLADTIDAYCEKGKLVSIVGRLVQRSYENKDKKKVHVVEIHVSELNMLSPKDAKPESGREEPEMPEGKEDPVLTPEEEEQLAKLQAKAKKGSPKRK